MLNIALTKAEFQAFQNEPLIFFTKVEEVMDKHKLPI